MSNSSPQPTNGLAVAALILSILAVLLMIPLSPLAFLLAVLGLIFSIVALRRHTSRGISITSLILSILGLLGSSIIFIFVFWVAKNVLDRTASPAVTTQVTNLEQTNAYGHYTLPTGWVEMTNLARGQKKFFAPASLLNQQPPFSNISVETGTNRYTLEQHEDFRRAILGQLAAQSSGSSAPTINGSGSHTAQGDILYTFILEDQDSTTYQYYIVGDQKYILVQLTDFADSDGLDLPAAAQEIVDSFVWN